MSKNVVAAAFAISLVACLPAKADMISVIVTGDVKAGTEKRFEFFPDDLALFNKR